jgi:hypothetical protein
MSSFDPVQVDRYDPIQTTERSSKNGPTKSFAQPKFLNHINLMHGRDDEEAKFSEDILETNRDH